MAGQPALPPMITALAPMEGAALASSTAEIPQHHEQGSMDTLEVHSATRSASFFLNYEFSKIDGV